MPPEIHWGPPLQPRKQKWYHPRSPVIRNGSMTVVGTVGGRAQNTMEGKIA